MADVKPKDQKKRARRARPAEHPGAAPDVVDQSEIVDEGSELSFPASDPPSYMGGAATAGPPPQAPREKPPLEAENDNEKEKKKE